MQSSHLRKHHKVLQVKAVQFSIGKQAFWGGRLGFNLSLATVFQMTLSRVFGCFALVPML